MPGGRSECGPRTPRDRRRGPSPATGARAAPLGLDGADGRRDRPRGRSPAPGRAAAASRSGGSRAPGGRPGRRCGSAAPRARSADGPASRAFWRSATTSVDGAQRVADPRRAAQREPAVEEVRDHPLRSAASTARSRRRRRARDAPAAPGSPVTAAASRASSASRGAPPTIACCSRRQPVGQRQPRRAPLDLPDHELLEERPADVDRRTRAHDTAPARASTRSAARRTGSSSI